MMTNSTFVARLCLAAGCLLATANAGDNRHLGDVTFTEYSGRKSTPSTHLTLEQAVEKIQKIVRGCEFNFHGQSSGSGFRLYPTAANAKAVASIICSGTERLPKGWTAHRSASGETEYKHEKGRVRSLKPDGAYYSNGRNERATLIAMIVDLPLFGKSADHDPL